MKKILLIIIAVCSLFTANAQNAIPNPGFETWKVNPNFDDPAGWGTINGFTYILGRRTVTKSTDKNSGSFAMKLETLNIPLQGNAPGIAATGSINTGGFVEGGVVFNKRPISFSGWYKYTPGTGGDTANIEAVLSKWNSTTKVREVVGEAKFNQTTTVGSYTKFDVNFSYSSNAIPDTLMMILLTSTRNTGFPLGSVLFVDDLAFDFCGNFGVSLTKTDVTTVGGSNGTATAAITAGTGTITYNWSPSGSGANPTGLSAGTYNLTVTDANGCTATASTVIAGPSCTGFSVSVSTTNVTTNGGSNGTATANVAGGSGNLSYTWTPSGSSANLTGLGANIYCVTVTNGNGCTANACGNVTSPSCANFSVSVATTPVSIIGGNNGTATATATGGTGSVTYSWSNDSTTNPINNLVTGTYTVTVIDAASCQAIGSAIVGSPSCTGFSVSIATTNVTTINGSNGTATTTVTGGSGNIAYNWSPSGTGANPTGLSAGTYNVTVTNGNGCTATATGIVGSPSCTGFTVSVSTTPESSPTSNNGTALATVTGGAGNITYTWSPTGSGQNLANLDNGVYCVTVTNGNGCTATDCDTVKTLLPSAISSLVETRISLYPNPASQQIVVEFSSDEARTFSIFDLSGKAVLVSELKEQKNVVFISEIHAGIYLYSVINAANEKIGYGKLIVQ